MATVSNDTPVAIAKSGVTVPLPPVTADMDGRTFQFMQVGGTTAFVLNGIAVISQSGTTNVGYLPDAAGDTITVMAAYDSAVSWYVLGNIIQ